MSDTETSKDMRKLKKLLRQIPPERMAIAQSLFKELSFMSETLGSLKQQVEREGPVSLFKQGKQQFLREHPAMKSYNQTVQRYSLLYKQLTDLLPPAAAGPPSDPLVDFIKGR